VKLSKHSVASAGLMADLTQAFGRNAALGSAERQTTSSRFRKILERGRRGGAERAVVGYVAGEIRGVPQRLPCRIGDRRIRAFLMSRHRRTRPGWSKRGCPERGGFGDRGAGIVVRLAF
jgi:hypothetical protein